MSEKELTPMEALKMAIDHEEKSYNLYKRAEAEISDKVTKKMFQFLAEEEIKHRKMLEEEYDRIFQPDN